jgi:hypothetical protein
VDFSLNKRIVASPRKINVHINGTCDFSKPWKTNIQIQTIKLKIQEMKNFIPLYNCLLAALLFSCFNAAQLTAQTTFPVPGFSLPNGKTIYITYEVTVDADACMGTPPANISNQASVSGNNFSTKLTDDPAFPGATDPTLTPFSVLTLSTVVTNESCAGAMDGAIDLTVMNGASPFTYQWSNLPGSPDPQDQMGLGAGTYSVTVTDNNGCSATTSVTLTSPPSGNILYVNANATGANNGSSWMDAFTSLQSALAINCPNITEIWVAAGTYKPTTGSDRTISFVMKNNLTIYGGFPNTGNPAFSNRNWGLNITILSGDIGAAGNADNSYSVVTGSSTNNTAILDGFTIQDGNANAAAAPGNYNSAARNGGGFYNSGGSPTVRNCYFKANTAISFGGGMFNYSSTNTSPKIINCAFSGNMAAGGGGICNGNVRGTSIPVITNCSFYGNTASLGGGIFVDSSKTQVINCIIWGNSSGLTVDPSDPVTITNSIIQGGCPQFATCTSVLNVDPLFVNAPGGNLHLQMCSPAENAGTATGAPATDYDGDVRPHGSGFDIGFDEFIGTPCCTFTLPANGMATVACPAQANIQPTPPVVTMNSCGTSVTMTGPVISATPACEGTKTYTWTYTDGTTTLQWVFTYTITRLDFTLPSNGASTVACPANTPQPVPPIVADNCGMLLNPTGPTVSATPACEGTKTYTWTYTDCAGHSHQWSFVYTITRLDFTVPANGSATVNCPSAITTPTPPTVTSNCGEPITPTGPTVSATPACEGTKTYTWTYMDCAGHSNQWSFVYTITRLDFTLPTNGAATVSCPAAITTPTPPTVTSNCGEPITPTGPTVSATPACEGTKTYTWTYADCAGHSHQWSFVYTITRLDFTVPANGAATVSCPAAITTPTPPTVTSNCGEPITPTGPTVSATPACEGTKTYTWTYTDCAGHSHQWSFVYTITRLDFAVPAHGAATVNCPSAITTPTPPTVTSNCGEPIMPTGPTVSATPACEGTKTYTWTYTDCAGHSHQWSFVYTIVRLDFAVPANGAATVACPALATLPTPPVVLSNCGETITPTGPTATATPACQGTKTYTWTYTDCAGHSHPWSFVYTITRLDFTVPTNGAATVSCAALATPPTPPTVASNCGETLTPTGPVIVNNPNPILCGGTRTYTWTYTDCAGHSHPWSFVYTINPVPFSVPANGAATVACPALATQPMPPVVSDACGNPTTPTGPVIVNNPNPIACEGTRTYTWTYVDCAGNMTPWSFVYTIERNDFSVPANGGATVNCPSAITLPTPPVVLSDCGETTVPTGPIVSPTPACEGTKIYTWTYTDCEGNTHPWSFVYTIVRLDFAIGTPNGAATVNCPSAITQPTPPTVQSNCGETITPTGPVIVNNPNPLTCQGTRTYTWTYTDCAGHSHQWSFVYTVIRLDFTIGTPNGSAMVACPSAITQPTPPTVQSNCGEIITPTGPVIVNNPNPLSCEGTRTYTWTYTDCAGHSHPWSFVYTVVRLDFAVPANGGSIVACPDETDVMPTPPVVLSNCGEVLIPMLTGVTPKNGCEGNRNYTWTYTDCAGHSHTWTYIYTVEYQDFSVPASESYTVECPMNAEQPTPPVVYDNCGKLLNPTEPVITSTNNAWGCEASRNYAWTYKDCEGNTHVWSVTYHFEYTGDFFVYPNKVAYVACLVFAQPPVPPTIYDNCGREILADGPTITEEISGDGCSGVRTFSYVYTDCGGNSHPWSFTYFADDNEPPVGNCPNGTPSSVDVTNLSCAEEVPCPTSYDFSDKIVELLAAGHFYDLCSGTDLVVSLESWSALWECSDPDGDGVYTFGRTFYFSIADQCGNQFPSLCAVTYSGTCQPIVTFPQSTWGLEDETSNIDLGVIQHLLDEYGPLKVGALVRSLALTDAQCVANLLPGQGGPDRLANCHQTNCGGCNPAGPNDMKNLLAANAIALQLSLRYSIEHNGADMPGMLAQSLGCIQLDPDIVTCANGPCKLHIFDLQGVEHLFPYTLGGLIDLVNYYLGGNLVLSDWQSGVYGTALNNAVDAVTSNWGNQQPSPNGCDPNPGVVSNPVVDKALPKVKLDPTFEEKEGLALELYPNPTGGRVTVRLKGFKGAFAQLTVTDRLGRVVLVQKIEEGTEQLQLDFLRKEFAAGEYFVRVVSSNGTLTKKLMIAK